MHIVLPVLAILAIINGSFEECVGGNIIEKTLTNEQKQAIVDRHNTYRNNVAAGRVSGQPSARNMLELEWNDELASLAQAWSDQCVFAHNSYEDRRLADGTYAGQNLAMVYSSSPSACKGSSPVSMVDMWYDEVKDYTYSTKFSDITGHYTQVVWAKTGKVGCGYTVFKKDGAFNCYLCCNYSPPGNYIGQYPYIQGKRNCPAYNLVDSYSYDNLCVAWT